MSAKLKEALDHMKMAEKALKTGLFKWNPDYDTAATEYTKAATCFKLAGSSVQCKDAYLKAAEMQEKMGSLFHSAKLLTQAAGIASDLKQIEEAVDLMEKACFLYREHGTPDTAAMTLSKAAKMCESGLPSRSVEMYLKAADLCEDDDKLRDASDYLNKASCIELKQKRYVHSAEIMKKRIELIKRLDSVNLGYTVVLGLVITYLAMEDDVAAENAFKSGFELRGFGESDHAAYSENFLKAFEEGDEELLSKTQSQPTVTHLDTEFARLAKTLKLPELTVPKSSAVVEEHPPCNEPVPSSGLEKPEESENNENTLEKGSNESEEEWDDLR